MVFDGQVRSGMLIVGYGRYLVAASGMPILAEWVFASIVVSSRFTRRLAAFVGMAMTEADLGVVYCLKIWKFREELLRRQAFRPPGAPQRTRQPRVRSRLRSERSAKTVAPAAVQRAAKRWDMIAPVMVMSESIRLEDSPDKTDDVIPVLPHRARRATSRCSPIISPPATSPQKAPEIPAKDTPDAVMRKVTAAA